MADGIDARDAQHVGDDRIAGAAPTLGRDAALAAEAHEVPADEEELGQAGALDDLQLVGQLLDHGRRQGVVALARALVAEPLEVGEGRLAARHREAREAVALEVEVDRCSAAPSSPAVRRPSPSRATPDPDASGSADPDPTPAAAAPARPPT